MENYAENRVRAVKFRALRIIEGSGVPFELWDHLVEYVVDLNNRTSHKTFRLQDRTPFEATLRRTSDTSRLVDFAFYDQL